MYIFPFTRIRYIKTITINTHIDCLNNSKCSVRDILLATKQGAFKSVFGTFSVKLYRFRAIIGHQGPLIASDPDWKGSKYNVQVEWETGEITFEPLSIIAANDPVTCAAYAKENDLLALEGWCRFRNLAKKDKVIQGQSSKVRSDK